MDFDGTCVRCGTQLKHLDTSGGCKPDSQNTHRHYRCPNKGCLAEGGTVVTRRGNVISQVGASVDVNHSNPRIDAGSVQDPTRGDLP